jgi:hypothetical protein
VATARELRTNGTAGTPAVIAAFLSTVRRVSVVFLIFSSLLNSRPTTLGPQLNVFPRIGVGDSCAPARRPGRGCAGSNLSQLPHLDSTGIMEAGPITVSHPAFPGPAAQPQKLPIASTGIAVFMPKAVLP